MLMLGATDPQHRNLYQWLGIGLGFTAGTVMALTALEGLIHFRRLTTIGKTVTVIKLAAGTTLTAAMTYIGVLKFKNDRAAGSNAGYHRYAPHQPRIQPGTGFVGAGHGHQLGGRPRTEEPAPE